MSGTVGMHVPMSCRALTKRQLQVISFAAAGDSNREISEKLFVTPSVVDEHVSAICTKLGARNKLHAVALAVRGGLV